MRPFFLFGLLGFDFASFGYLYVLRHPYGTSTEEKVRTAYELLNAVPRRTRLQGVEQHWHDPHGFKLWEYWKARCLNYWLRATRRHLARKHMFV